MTDILMVAVYMIIPALFALMGGIYLGIRLNNKKYRQWQESQQPPEKITVTELKSLDEIGK